VILHLSYGRERSVLDFLELWLDNMTHLGTWLARFEGCKKTIWLGNLYVWRHVRVGTWKGRCLNASRCELGFQSLALAAIFRFLFATLGVTLMTLPLHLCIFGGRQVTL